MTAFCPACLAYTDHDVIETGPGRIVLRCAFAGVEE